MNYFAYYPILFPFPAHTIVIVTFLYFWHFFILKELINKLI